MPTNSLGRSGTMFQIPLRKFRSKTWLSCRSRAVSWSRVPILKTSLDPGVPLQKGDGVELGIQLRSQLLFCGGKFAVLEDREQQDFNSTRLPMRVRRDAEHPD